MEQLLKKFLLRKLRVWAAFFAVNDDVAIQFQFAADVYIKLPGRHDIF